MFRLKRIIHEADAGLFFVFFEKNYGYEMVKYIVGITGGSGVGKTTLIKELFHQFKGSIAKLSLDNYYLPIDKQQKDEQGIVNFDLPEGLDSVALKRDLEKLLNNQSVFQQEYNFNHPDKDKKQIEIAPKPLIIIEGLFVMHFEFIREALDYSVYLTVDKEKQLQRRLKRDTEERNYSEKDILYQWENHVIPAYKAFVEPYKKSADLIITNNDKFDENILILEKKMREAISN